MRREAATGFENGRIPRTLEVNYRWIRTTHTISPLSSSNGE